MYIACVCFVYIACVCSDCSGSLLLCGLSSSCGEHELLSGCRTWDSHCGGFSCCSARAPGHPGCSSCGSETLEHRLVSLVAHRLGCSAACVIFLDQGSNLCVLHWEADSLPLKPFKAFLKEINKNWKNLTPF